MNDTRLNQAFDCMAPDDTQKTRMFRAIFCEEGAVAGKPRVAKTRKGMLTGATAACLALALTLFLTLSLGGGTVAFALSIGNPDAENKVTVLNSLDTMEENTTTVSKIDSRPDLEFYIDGEDIAKIEITCETEFLYVVDWTETQEEKYWNAGVYQEYDEQTGRIAFYPELLYSKTCVLTFPEGFDNYDQIWYRWTAWNLYEWASEDDYSHFQGAGIQMANSSDGEKLSAAAGDNSTANGHILLDDYPADKLSDHLVISITDRKGNTTTKTIVVTVSNNEIGQTVVTSELLD